MQGSVRMLWWLTGAEMAQLGMLWLSKNAVAQWGCGGSIGDVVAQLGMLWLSGDLVALFGSGGSVGDVAAPW
jgi:hypothetical protein